METLESLVAQNVADLREARGLTVRALSARLDEIGAKILPSGITKIENRTRGVSVADLVALAVALGVNPNRLLLPGRADDREIAVTPETRTTGNNAWNWADGRWPLRVEDDHGRAWAPEGRQRVAEFRAAVRPTNRAHLEQHTASLAAQDVLLRIQQLLITLDKRLVGTTTITDMQGAAKWQSELEAVEDRFVDPEQVAEAQGGVRRALDRLTAEVADLLGGGDAGR